MTECMELQEIKTEGLLPHAFERCIGCADDLFGGIFKQLVRGSNRDRTSGFSCQFIPGKQYNPPACTGAGCRILMSQHT